MSYEKSVFVLVEGKVFDPHFADKVCSSSDVIRESGYEIREISQVKNDEGKSSGGKAALVDFFEYCKKRGKLRQANAGGDRVLAFMADRDSQHITGGMKRSPHLIYTVYADVEAHVFSESDEKASLAVAASLDSASANDLVRALGDWRSDIAGMWRHWIELCYVAEATRSRSWVGLGAEKSRIHEGRKNRILSSARMSEAVAAVQSGSLLGADEFCDCRDRVLSKIAAVYKKHQEATLIKGKWLPAQLTFMVEDYFKSNDREWHDKGFRESVTRCYFAHMKLDAPGISKIRSSIEGLL